MQIGVFFIRKQRENPNYWDLFINNLLLGSYIAPEIAADAVSEQKTNYKNWDSLNTVSKKPDNLSDWIKVDEDFLFI